MRCVLVSSVLALTFVGAGAARAGAEPPGCLKCHADEATMKALVKPPTHGSSEGEG